MKYTQPVGGAVNAPYVDGNPGAGIEGSAVPAAAIEHPQREIVAVITAAGLTPDQNTLNQLHAAILALIAANATVADASTTVKGKIEIATDAEAMGGTDTVRAVTSANLASSKSLASNGYMKLPGGLLFQWGKYVGHLDQAQATITLPVAYPTAFLNIQVSPYKPADASGAGSAWSGAGDIISTSQFKIHGANNTDNPDGFYWFAIGN